MSTTAILRWVYQETNGDLRRAMTILWSLNRYGVENSHNAKNAYHVLHAKAQNHPGSTHFAIRHDGFIELRKAA